MCVPICDFRSGTPGPSSGSTGRLSLTAWICGAFGDAGARERCAAGSLFPGSPSASPGAGGGRCRARRAVGRVQHGGRLLRGKPVPCPGPEPLGPADFGDAGGELGASAASLRTALRWTFSEDDDSPRASSSARWQARDKRIITKLFQGGFAAYPTDQLLPPRRNHSECAATSMSQGRNREELKTALTQEDSLPRRLHGPTSAIHAFRN
jgi:hypothetical protein